MFHSSSSSSRTSRPRVWYVCGGFDGFLEAVLALAPPRVTVLSRDCGDATFVGLLRVLVVKFFSFSISHCGRREGDGRGSKGKKQRKKKRHQEGGGEGGGREGEGGGGGSRGKQPPLCMKLQQYKTTNTVDNLAR